MLGYGTQFAPELDEGERVVDCPLPISVESSVFEDRPTAAQITALYKRSETFGMSKEKVNERIKMRYAKDCPEDLTQSEFEEILKDLINAEQERRNNNSFLDVDEDLPF